MLDIECTHYSEKNKGSHKHNSWIAIKYVFKLGVRAAAILDLGVSAEYNPVECVSRWILFKYTIINICVKFRAFFPYFSNYKQLED